MSTTVNRPTDLATADPKQRVLSLAPRRTPIVHRPLMGLVERRIGDTRHPLLRPRVTYAWAKAGSPA